MHADVAVVTSASPGRFHPSVTSSDAVWGLSWRVDIMNGRLTKMLSICPAEKAAFLQSLGCLQITWMTSLAN